MFQRGLKPPTCLVVLQRRVWFISLGVSTPCPQLLTVMCPAGMCPVTRKYCLRNLVSNTGSDDFHQLCFCAFFVRKDEGKKIKKLTTGEDRVVDPAMNDLQVLQQNKNCLVSSFVKPQKPTI